MGNSFNKADSTVATPGLMTVSATPEGLEGQEHVNPSDIQHRSNVSRFLQDANNSGSRGVEVTPEGGVKRMTATNIEPGMVAQSGFKGDVLSTLTTKTGRPLNDLTQATPDSLVRIAGVQCTVETALQMGVLTRDAQGNLRDANTAHAELLKDPAADFAYDRQELAEIQAENLRPHDFASECTNGSNKALETMEARLGKDHADSITIRALSSAVRNDSDISLQAVSELATGLGIEPEKAVDALERIGTTYLTNAAQYMEKAHGVEDGMEVLEWLGEALAPEGASRFISSLIAGSTALVDEAVKAYTRRRR